MAHSAPCDGTVGFADGSGVGPGVGSCVDAVAFVGAGAGMSVGVSVPFVGAGDGVAVDGSVVG
jgi:hypothetical protein